MATTRTVTTTADSGAGSLRQAITDSANGDKIVFDSTAFPNGVETTILLGSPLPTGNKTVEIDGGTTWKVNAVIRTIDGVETLVVVDENNPAQEGESVFQLLRTRVVLDGQSTTNITPTSQYGSPSFSGITFAHCAKSSATLGSVVSATSSRLLTLTDCVFRDCNDSYGVVYIYGSGNHVFTRCEFVSINTTSRGGLYAWVTNTASSLSLVNCKFILCSSSGNSTAGILHLNSGNVVGTNCEFLHCKGSGTYSGGAIYINSGKSHFTSCEFNGCSGQYGGAIYSGSTTSEFTSCQFNDCHVKYVNGGGAIWANGGTPVFTSCEINGCYVIHTGTGGSAGGAVYVNGGSPQFISCLMKDCYATEQGSSSVRTGGVYVSGGTPRFESCVIQNCSVGTDYPFYIKSGTTTFKETRVTSDGTQYDRIYHSYTNYNNTYVRIEGRLYADLVQQSGYSRLEMNGGACSTLMGHGSVLKGVTGAGILALEDLSVVSGVSVSADVAVIEYGAGMTAFSASVSEDTATFEIEKTDANKDVGVIVSFDEGATWKKLTLDGNAATLPSAKACKFRAFDGLNIFTTDVFPRSYYYKGAASGGSFANPSDWALDAARTKTCPDVPTIKGCTFDCR